MNLRKTIPMTSELLGLIIMVQDYKQFKVSEYMFKQSHGLDVENYDKEVENLYYSIDNDILNKYGLSKNKISFNRISSYCVSEEMLSTESHLLPTTFVF